MDCGCLRKNNIYNMLTHTINIVTNVSAKYFSPTNENTNVSKKPDISVPFVSNNMLNEVGE